MPRIGVGMAILGVLISIGCASPSAPPPTQAPRPTQVPPPQLDVTDGPRYPTRIRVGATDQITLTVHNAGPGDAREVWLLFQDELFTGVLMLESTPKVVKDERTGGARFLKFGPLASGASQNYKISVTGKTAGEYRFDLTISGLPGNGHSYDGRVVVLP